MKRGLEGLESWRTCTLPLNWDCFRLCTYRSMDASSSHAFLEEKDVQGSLCVTLIVGVTGVGEIGDCGDKDVFSMKPSATSGSYSGSSSANTRVGLLAWLSHGKMGFGLTLGFGFVSGTSYHIFLGGSGYSFGAWKRSWLWDME